MRIVVVHDHYQQPGGEDSVFAAETALLEARGHLAARYTVHNDAVEDMNRLALAKATVWNSDPKLQALLRRERPDVVHFHNTLPLISPAAYYAARQAGAAVVQTLHNYRLMCPGALFLREGRACEDCLGRRFALPAVRHGCYRGNRAATGVVAFMVAAHRAMGTWREQVNVYIAVSEFVRAKFIQGQLLPAEKIVVKPHFVDPEPAIGRGGGSYALFVGRLSHEKGLDTLVEAWKQVPEKLKLKIVGDGPLAPLVAEAAAELPHVEWVGRKTPDEVISLLAAATVAVVPSECYETFGRVAMEAFSVGTPVVASNIGAVAELVDHDRTGRLFQPGDAADLAAQALWVLQHPSALHRMREAARSEYEAKYTAGRNFEQLMDIYARAVQDVQNSRKRSTFPQGSMR